MSRVPGTYRAPVREGVWVGVLSGELGRYSKFFQDLMGLSIAGNLPPGSGVGWVGGVNIPKACNTLVEQALSALSCEWLWIIGDDHAFPKNTIRRLLAHDVDVIVPHCLKRTPPWQAVVYSHRDPDGYYVVADLPERGLTEIHAAGSAGMLIRRRVLEQMDAPWFAPSPDAEGLNEDLWFCEKVHQAGFDIHCDPEIVIGHIATHSVWPVFENGQWNARFDHGSMAIHFKKPRVEVPA